MTVGEQLPGIALGIGLIMLACVILGYWYWLSHQGRGCIDCKRAKEQTSCFHSSEPVYMLSNSLKRTMYLLGLDGKIEAIEPGIWYAVSFDRTRSRVFLVDPEEDNEILNRFSFREFDKVPWTVRDKV